METNQSGSLDTQSGEWTEKELMYIRGMYDGILKYSDITEEELRDDTRDIRSRIEEAKSGEWEVEWPDSTIAESPSEI